MRLVVKVQTNSRTYIYIIPPATLCHNRFQENGQIEVTEKLSKFIMLSRWINLCNGNRVRNMNDSGESANFKVVQNIYIEHNNYSMLHLMDISGVYDNI